MRRALFPVTIKRAWHDSLIASKPDPAPALQRQGDKIEGDPGLARLRLELGGERAWQGASNCGHDQYGPLPQDRIPSPQRTLLPHRSGYVLTGMGRYSSGVVVPSTQRMDKDSVMGREPLAKGGEL